MKLLAYLMISFFSLFSVVNCHADEADNIQHAKAMVETINQRDLAGLDTLIAPNVKRHSTATAGVIVTNLEEFKAFLESDFVTVPDSVMELDVIFGNDEYVAMRAIYSGTQSGQMGPFLATGKHFELPFIGILRFEDEMIAEIWVEWDNMHALTQLGHLAPPEQ